MSEGSIGGDPEHRLYRALGIDQPQARLLPTDPAGFAPIAGGVLIHFHLQDQAAIGFGNELLERNSVRRALEDLRVL